ncbi:MAG: CotH kinase family protein, partial [Bacteroidota bacterium]|nr:CotH kinase family protein [Bacteroidota bacterium]
MTTEPDISGGYLLEVDGFASGEQVWFKTANGMPVTVKYPDDEDINDQQLTYITQFTQSFENTLLSASFDDPAKGYRAMVDTTSLIDWYLASEYTANPDCFWSTNIYKFRNDQRFYFGPLWDYDIAFCNDTRMGNTIDKYMYQSAFDPKTWVKQYWCDGWFVRAINRRWSDLVKKGLLDHLNTYVDSLRLQLDASQKLNFTRWPVLSTRVYLEYSLFPTYIQGIYYLKDFLSEREKFLTANLPLAVPGEPERPAEPFVAGAFYYLIMNRQTSNVVDINGRSTAENTKLVMWNPLDGQLSQQWSILPVRDNIFRFVNRYSGLAIQANGHGNNMTQVKPDSAIPTQQWKIVPSTTSSAYFLESVQDGYTADNSGGSSANGTGFIEWDVKASGYDNQLWYLQKADVLETALDQSLGEVFTFMIYPNPVSETLYLSCSGLGNQPMSIELYSVQGTVVNRMQSRDKDVRIAVDNLPKGLYLLKVTAGGRSYVTKFLKQ